MTLPIKTTKGQKSLLPWQGGARMKIRVRDPPKPSLPTAYSTPSFVHVLLAKERRCSFSPLRVYRRLVKPSLCFLDRPLSSLNSFWDERSVYSPNNPGTGSDSPESPARQNHPLAKWRSREGEGTCEVLPERSRVKKRVAEADLDLML